MDERVDEGSCADKRVRCSTTPMGWTGMSKHLLWWCVAYLGSGAYGPARACRRWRTLIEEGHRLQRRLVLDHRPELARLVSGAYPESTARFATELRELVIDIPWSAGMAPLLAAPHLRAVSIHKRIPIAPLEDGFLNWIRDTETTTPTARTTLVSLYANVSRAQADLWESVLLCTALVHLSLVLVDDTMEPPSCEWLAQLPPTLRNLAVVSQAPTPPWARQAQSWMGIQNRALDSCQFTFKNESFGWNCIQQRILVMSSSDATMALWIRIAPRPFPWMTLYCAQEQSPQTRHEVLSCRPSTLNTTLTTLGTWLQVAGDDWSFIQRITLRASVVRVDVDLKTRVPNLTELTINAGGFSPGNRFATCFHVDMCPPTLTQLNLDDSQRGEFKDGDYPLWERVHDKLKSIPTLKRVGIQVYRDHLLVDWTQKRFLTDEVDNAPRLAWWRRCFERAFSVAPASPAAPRPP